jgi:hypothetical protein
MNTKDSIETIEKQNKAAATKSAGAAPVPAKSGEAGHPPSEQALGKKPTDSPVQSAKVLSPNKVGAPAVIKPPVQRMRMYAKDPGKYYFFCPGCAEYHSVSTTRPNANGTVFRISGTLQLPTVTPMINRSIEKFNSSKHANNPAHVCNSFIVEGKIRFLENCTHALAGRQVDLPNVD